jgi:hypothetical protein
MAVFESSVGLDSLASACTKVIDDPALPEKDLRNRNRQERRHKMIARVTGFVMAAAFLATAAPQKAAAQNTADQSLIHQGYDYTFPLYLLLTYRWTALKTIGGRISTTLNHYTHSRKIATQEDKWADAPIVDALYSTAWIDLSLGPLFVETPDTHGRYYVLTLIDFYSNTFFYIGHRTTGTEAQKYLLVGPAWEGQTLGGATLVRSPTNDVYVNLRVQTDGPSDQAAANAIQDGFLITTAGSSESKSVARIQPVSGDPKNYVDIANQMLQLDPPSDSRSRAGRQFPKGRHLRDWVRLGCAA